jgi:hypothetical protein
LRSLIGPAFLYKKESCPAAANPGILTPRYPKFNHSGKPTPASMRYNELDNSQPSNAP